MPKSDSHCQILYIISMSRPFSQFTKHLHISMGWALPCPLPSGCFCWRLYNLVNDAIRRMLSTCAFVHHVWWLLQQARWLGTLDFNTLNCSRPWACYFPLLESTVKNGKEHIFLSLSLLDLKYMVSAMKISTSLRDQCSKKSG